jgi:hypothetical protein
MVVTCRGGPPSPPEAGPDTATTAACGWTAHPLCRRRAWPSTRSPVTHGAGRPAAKARGHSARARWGVRSNPRSSGMPAGWPRGRSSVQASGRARGRSSRAWPRGRASPPKPPRGQGSTVPAVPA